MQSGNWRVARDTVWELGGGARDPARELEGARDALCRYLIIKPVKNCGTGLVPAKSTGTGPVD